MKISLFERSHVLFERNSLVNTTYLVILGVVNLYDESKEYHKNKKRENYFKIKRQRG